VDVDEGKVRRLHANKRMVPAASKADHREVQAMAAAVRRRVCCGFVLCQGFDKAVDSVRQDTFIIDIHVDDELMSAGSCEEP
jgi:phytoene/squalene synthetase